jgi:CheY-like chemotaxis protein
MLSDEAEDGAQVLLLLQTAVAQGTPYDLAILDFQMPVMDGIELTCRIKADAALQFTPLVMLSSLGMRDDIQAARQAGVSAHLTKPIRQSQLFDCLATLLGQPLPQPAPSRALPSDLPRVASLPTSRSLILLAEDNVVNQKLAVRLLEKMGCRCDVVANGAEAVAAVQRIAYALVLMDCQMPEIDGFEATKTIRESEQGTNTHIPIVAMTANAMQGDRERCLEAGMDDYVSKPIKPETLRTVLIRWLLLAEEQAA